MIEKQFWKDVKSVWIKSAPPKSTNIYTGSGGEIDSSLSDDSWEEEVLFDDIDYDKSVESMMSGGDFVLKNNQNGSLLKKQPVPAVPSRPKLDIISFEREIDKGTLAGFVQAAKLLLKCELPEEMAVLYQTLISRLPVLQDAVEKFKGVYQPDMDQFYEYYIPDALQLTSVYLEYLDAGVGDDIIKGTETEIMDAVDRLIDAVNGKIDEIYKFASIEIKAQAKALESLMSQDGYVDSDFKIKR